MMSSTQIQRDFKFPTGPDVEGSRDRADDDDEMDEETRQALVLSQLSGEEFDARLADLRLLDENQDDDNDKDMDMDMDEETRQALLLSQLPPEIFDEQLSYILQHNIPPRPEDEKLAAAPTKAAEPIVANATVTLGGAKMNLRQLSNVHDIAVDDAERAVLATPDGHKDKAGFLNNYGLSLLARFQRAGEISDINSAIVALQQAVSVEPANMFLANLGLALQTRFNRSGEPADLDQAIGAQTQVVLAAPAGSPQRHAWLNNLGNSLWRRVERDGNLADVDRTVEVKQEVVMLTADSEQVKAGFLGTLALALLKRFELRGELIDIERASEAMQRAIGMMPHNNANKPFLLDRLSYALWGRFEIVGDPTDLVGAVDAQSRALSLIPDSDLRTPAWLNNLGNLLRRRFERLGELGDIIRAVEVQDRAISMWPDADQRKAVWLNHLGNSLRRRFERLQDVVDIDRTIEVTQRAASTIPVGHAERPGILNNLGLSLRTRFERLGELADVDRAIEVQTEVVSSTPDTYADKPALLLNLGTSLVARFNRLGVPADINRAIQFQTQSVALAGDGRVDRDKVARLSNLGNALWLRFNRLGETSDILRAVEVAEEALLLTPKDHPDQLSLLHNYGNLLFSQFERSGEPASLDRSIDMTAQAVTLIPNGHANKAMLFTNFGRLYMLRYRHSSNPVDVDKAIQVLQTAATTSTGSPYVRFKGCQFWITALEMKSPPVAHDDILVAHSVLLDILPKIVSFGARIQKRFEDIRETIGHSVVDAVAAAIKAEKYELAVEWMEQGRSIIWGQLLRLRSPLDNLRASHPNIADELDRVSHDIDASSLAYVNPDGQSGFAVSLEQQAQSHRRNAEKRECIMSEIHALPGFEEFLEPEKFSVLASVARDSFVVLINVSKSRCDALVLSPSPANSVIHIPLPGLSLEKATQLQTRLLASLHMHGARSEITADRKLVLSPFGVDDLENDLEVILSELWDLVVQVILGGMKVTPKPSDAGRLPHMVWCPTGPLSFLPLHAAGVYGCSDPSLAVSAFDLVVSSYTPSLTALLNPGRQSTPCPRVSPSPSILIVTQPNAPGLSPLPGTLQEARTITDVTSKYNLSLQHLTRVQATISTVLETISQHEIVHLACHGTQHPVDPLKSAFCLYDGKLHLEALMAKSLDKAQLAFLSACQTATGDATLSEESVHLASGMLSAGFPSVVGTMWSIGDGDAPEVARVFYTSLFDGMEGQAGRLDTAYALHDAVQHLRRKIDTSEFLRWVPFVHFGL